MPRSLPFAALILTTLFAGGCNTSRMLTRRDYQETRDPFMDGSRDVGGRNAASGVASLDAPTSDVPGGAVTTNNEEVTPPLPGPKPIQRVSGFQQPQAVGAGIARAAYPEPESSNHAATADPSTAGTAARSWQGPSLSSFLSGRDVPPAETISGESVRNRTSASTTAFAQPGTGSGRRSPAAEAAALSEMNREIGGFSSFLEESAGEGTAAATQAGRLAGSAADGAAASAGDFADFASRKRAEWAAQARSAQSAAQNAASTAKSTAAAAAERTGKAARSASDDFFEQLAAPAAEQAAAADAKAATTSADPTSSDSVTAAGTGSVENPFDEMPSFDENDEESMDSLDAGFSGEPGAIPAGFSP
ncbi:MAG: hypothetical protein ACKO2L_13595 [Planctomycetaceae bacterium]